MTIPIDVTDPRIVKAYGHPLRIQILRRLEDRVASPHELARELGVPLANASYHVRRLRDLGLIELVGRNFRRGAVEHRYTARYHAIFSDAEWADVPTVLKRAYLGGLLDTGWAQVAAAANGGGFDRPDIHYSRTSGRLDDQAWGLVADELKRTLARIEQIVRESEARLGGNGAGAAQDATVMMLHFADRDPTEIDLEPIDRHDGIRAAGATAVRAERDATAPTHGRAGG